MMVLAAASLAAVVFVLDSMLPLGVAGGVPYVALVLLGWWFEKTRHIVVLAVVSSALIIVGYLISPSGGIPWVVATNRVYALFAVWVTAALLAKAKSVEIGLRQARADLEQRVEERTTELLDAQHTILRKERLAALGQLTGTVAHELRNPLGTIATSIALIRHPHSKAGPELDGALDRASRSIERCDTIITELLDFARAKGLQTEPMNLDAWLSGVLREVHVPAGIKLTQNLRTDGATVCFDPDQLRRAVVNVVDNACQAMTNGSSEKGATASSELTATTRMNGERVEIDFTDTGPGIPDQVLPRVLEPLFSTKSFGTGLGLPTVQRIMDEHGGGLQISSEEGRGAQVLLWLPLGFAPEEAPQG